ncbi:MAG TPA: ATP-binding protein [Candidatus Methylomirabilis sp.]|nr:ATP-binding protein [Candidatus Methylomirabilis sp.]
MIERSGDLDVVRTLLRRYPAVGIVGARQVGKTTLARTVAARATGPVYNFDLENPDDLAQLAEPMLALKDRRGLVVIDEVQRRPDLFPVLRVLADRPRSPARFLILGSASPAMLQQTSETLAGRIGYHELRGLALEDVGRGQWMRLWIRGGFPRAYLARSAAASDEWRRNFIRTFLERDLPQLGIGVRSTTLHRFWTMLAHYHGQTWNASEFARSFGVADTTVRNYLDVLSAALVIRQLPPWHENISKRQVRAPKVYVLDSGLLHTLLNLADREDVERHPKLGASWEGFVLEQIIRRLRARREECFFWRTHAGAELDLLVTSGRHRIGFEVKRTSAPQVTPSMRAAFVDLRLATLDVVHAGDRTFPLSDKIRAVALSDLLDVLQPLRSQGTP